MHRKGRKWLKIRPVTFRATIYDSMSYEIEWVSELRKVSIGFREDLEEWVHFDTLEYTMYGVGIFAGKQLRFLQGVGFDDDETPGFVGQRACQDNAPLGAQWREIGQMSRPMDFSFGFPVRAIESQDHKFHGYRW